MKNSNENACCIHTEQHALVVASTAYHIDKFLRGQINSLKELGYTVHIATGFNVAHSRNSSNTYIERCRDKFICNGLIVHELPFTRSPVSINNLRALYLFKRLLKAYPFRLVHCHTPTGGLIARIGAMRQRRKGVKVIYTAHGFHFFRGAPILNWLLYYPVEWLLARATDCLIVINQEDEQIACKMPANWVARVNGVGVSAAQFEKTLPLSNSELNLPETAFVFLCIGELSKRKNQGLLIRSFSRASRQCPDAVLLLAGEGDMRLEYQNLANTLLTGDKIRFLGWRDDIPALILSANVVVSAAKQEGLPVNLIEAMIAGKPIVASDCRGNRELAQQAGIVASNENEFAEAMALLYSDAERRTHFARISKASSHKYESRVIDKEMNDLYKMLLY